MKQLFTCFLLCLLLQNVGCKKATSTDKKKVGLTFYKTNASLGNITVKGTWNNAPSGIITQNGAPSDCKQSGYANFEQETGTWYDVYSAKSDKGYTWNNGSTSFPIDVKDQPCNLFELTKSNSNEADCNFTEYSGTNGCTTADYIPVNSTTCCPSDKPFFGLDKYGNKGCFATCTEAKDWVAGGGSGITFGTGAGATVCKYTQVYSFPNTCASNATPVSYGPQICCAKSTPYYCGTTGQCYSTCEDANAACGGTGVLKGP